MTSTNLSPIWLDSDNINFPHPDQSLTEPDGLLAIGGDLSPQRIINGQPILWWSPNPRAVLFPKKLHISKSLKKIIRKQTFHTTVDQAFEQVINQCAKTPRSEQGGTWITQEMKDAYIYLHQLGFAHSAECWLGNQLVGGLYGLAIGRVFFGESMFSHQSNASKIAFVHLVDKLLKADYALIDCQVGSQHLFSLGAEEIPRNQFLKLVHEKTQASLIKENWLINSSV